MQIARARTQVLADRVGVGGDCRAVRECRCAVAWFIWYEGKRVFGRCVEVMVLWRVGMSDDNARVVVRGCLDRDRPRAV
jgi:hypothetical protein